MTLGIDKLTHIGGKARPRDKNGQRYVPVVLESYKEYKNGHEIHARPIKGQGKFRPELDAECSKPMRRNHPIGTMFLVWGIVINRNGTELVYTYEDWPYEIIGK